MLKWKRVQFFYSQCTGWPKKTGPACFIANILKTPRPNCVEILRVLACLFTHYHLVWWRHTWRHSFIYFRSHTARDTVRYLQRNNVASIEPDVWPPNSPDLNPVNYAVGGGEHFNNWFTNIEASRLSPNWSRQSLMLGRNCRSRLLTEASTNGVVALSAWYIRMGAISNICLNK